MDLGELGMSMVILIAAVFLFFHTFTFPTFPQYRQVDSDFWPKIILLMLIFTSAMLVVETWRKRRNVADQDQQKEDYDPKGLTRMLGTGALLLLYIFIGLQYMGFLLSTLLFNAGLMYWLGNRKPVFLILVPLLVSGLSVFIFCRLMLIPLPRGVGVFRLISLWFY